MALTALALLLLSSRGLEVGDHFIHLATSLNVLTRAEATLGFCPDNPALGIRGVATSDCYSSLSPGFPLLILPLVASAQIIEDDPEIFLQKIRPLFTEPQTITGLEAMALFRELQADARVQAMALLCPISAAILIALLMLVALRSGVEFGVAIGGCFVLLLGPFGVTAGTGWTQVPVALGLFVAAERLGLLDLPSPALGLARAVGAGVAMAVVASMRLDALPLLMLMGALALRKQWTELGGRMALRLAAWACLPVAGAGVLWLGWNVLRFGGISGPEAAFQLERWTLSEAHLGFLGQLFSPEDGLLWFAPWSLVALGWACWHARKGALSGTPSIASTPGIAAILGILMVQLLTYAAWWDWNSKMSYGPRYLVPSLPFLALLAMHAWRKGRPALRVLLCCGVLIGLVVSLPGFLVHPVKLPVVPAAESWSMAAPAVGWTLVATAWDSPGSGQWAGHGIDCLAYEHPGWLIAGLVCLGLGLATLACTCRRSTTSSAQN